MAFFFGPIGQHIALVWCEEAQAPLPHRGKPNLPEYVRDVAEYLAVLRGVSFEQLAEQTTANFKRLFPLARVA